MNMIYMIGGSQTHPQQRSIARLWWKSTIRTAVTLTSIYQKSFISLRRAGLQCSDVFMFVSTVDPGLQELQRYGRLWRACPMEKSFLINCK
ncbi:hypothetical protein SFRURICE_006795 [Spodoptera frugiperda]|nr:hypothetical protein SFRURICE_006795 [Spodoptera frugiperda]